MEQTTLAALTVQESADAFNLVYTDYFVPSKVDAQGMRQHIDAMDIALEDSPLLLDAAGTVVGLAALGVRGRRGWVGSFGVAPAYRGRGLSHTLIVALLDRARRRGLRSVALEVLVQNSGAIRAYDAAGFVQRRDLRVFRWDAPVASGVSADVHPAESAALLSLRSGLGLPPPWQREPRSIARTVGVAGLALGRSEATEAFVLYRASDVAVSILDIAVAGAGAVVPLLDALVSLYPNRPMRLVNEPEESPVCAALEALGWSETLRQHEMICSLE